MRNILVFVRERARVDDLLMFPISSMMKSDRPAILCRDGAFRRTIGRNCNGSKIPAAL